VQVRISRHTLLRARKRGVKLAEVEDVLASGQPAPAALGRLAPQKVYPFYAVWQGRFHGEKKVRVVYVIDQGVVWICRQPFRNSA